MTLALVPHPPPQGKKKGYEWHGTCLCTFYAKGMGHPLGICADGSGSGHLKADANDDPWGTTRTLPTPLCSVPPLNKNTYIMGTSGIVHNRK